MTLVLVHGVPETTAVWDRLVPLLDIRAITLGLPGFGNRRPDGFGSTMDEYATWLHKQLSSVEGPVDLVRSATDIPGEWGPGTRPTEPGLVIGADSDPLVSAESSRRAAEKVGADVAILEGAGHWWPLDSPGPAAEALQKFWAKLA